MGGWSSLISPQIGCSIISDVIKISWGWHGDGKRILMLGHLFLFEAPYHTNDEWNDSAVCSGCGAVSKWVAWRISQIHLRIWAQKAASFQSISCVLEAGALGTQVGSLINRGMVNSHCCRPDPYVMLEVCPCHPHQQCLWDRLCFLQLPLALCYSLSARGLTLKKNSCDTVVSWVSGSA